MKKKNYFFALLVFCLFSSSNLFSQSKPIYTIKPGEGFEDCKLGDSKDDLESKLGTPSKNDGTYIDYYEKGLEVLMRDDKVSTIFLIYRSKTHMTFDGVTDKKIGFNSTIPEVMRLYGKPSRIGNSIVSSYGTFPGAHEYYLEYNSLGIAFTFYDNELADIRIWEAKEK
ncbi:MAG: hypothetical protein NTU73_09130 [Ignavibacteriae bacterium]|nr:hypothetical protein [Ignavibacteriota bacterium]